MVSTAMNDKVYKIFTECEWKHFQEAGQFKGSADDLRDGFIHLSTEEQVDGVIEKHFSGQHPLYVAEFSGLSSLQKLKWEISASGGVYPHLYDVYLLPGEVTAFIKL